MSVTNEKYVKMSNEVGYVATVDIKLSAAQRKVVVDAGVKLMLQGVQSYSKDLDACLYRHEIDGKKVCCVVGHLIKDEHFEAKLEQKGVSSFLVIEAIAKSIGDSLVDTYLIYVLKALQACHDTYDSGVLYSNTDRINSEVDQIGIFDNNEFRSGFIKHVGYRTECFDNTLYIDILNEYNKQGRLPAETTGENNV